MKRLFCILLALLLLAGCQYSSPETSAPTQTETVGNAAPYEPPYLPVIHQVQYVRTNGYREGVQYPQVISVKNRAELDAYYEQNRERYDLERKEQVYADTTLGFLDACDRYDDAFFGEKALLLILLEEGSGSVSHQVESLELTLEKKLRVNIHRQVPEVGTSDMAQWHIILEVGNKMPTAEDVQVYLDGRLAWSNGLVVPPKREAAFKAPPVCMVRTAAGEGKLDLGGYQWNYEDADGICVSAVTDQTARPLPTGSLTPIGLESWYAETVYLPVPGEDYYAPADEKGFLVKLNWEERPDSVTCTRWFGTKEEQLPFDLDGPFYASTYMAVYEFAATWENDGSGYWGEANYYLCIGEVFACG